MVKNYQKSTQLFDIHNPPHSMQRSVGAGFSCPPSCQPIPGHCRVRQSGHFLETASLLLPLAALRRFPRRPVCTAPHENSLSLRGQCAHWPWQSVPRSPALHFSPSLIAQTKSSGAYAPPLHTIFSPPHSTPFSSKYARVWRIFFCISSRKASRESNFTSPRSRLQNSSRMSCP